MNMQSVTCLRGRAARYAGAALGASALLAFGLSAPAAAAAQAAAPTTLYVMPGGNDSGTCPSANPCATVSYALTQAASGATINVTGTIINNVTVSKAVTITTWPGQSPAVLDGTANNAPVVDLEEVSGGGVTLHDLTIENGNEGVHVWASTLTVTDSTISGNTGPGIDTAGPVTVTDSTITNNAIAGIKNNGATTTAIASTISGNTGYGIWNLNGTVAMGATIVAGNTGTVAGTASANCDPAAGPGSIVSATYNLTNDPTGTACGFIQSTDLVNKNPLLGHLASNGGPTQTMLPAGKSPAADVIPKTTTLRGVAVCPGTDQRGVTRPGRGKTRCTIGAAEVGFKNPTTTSVTASPATVASGTGVAYQAEVTPKSGSGVPTGSITFTTGSTTLCTAVLSGAVAACGATTAPVGTDTITGTYSGGDGYASSSGTATLTVTTG